MVTAVPAPVLVQRTLEMALGDAYQAYPGSAAVLPVATLDRIIHVRIAEHLRETQPSWYSTALRSWRVPGTPPPAWIAARWLARRTPAEALRVAGAIAGPG
jgi:hypothetical protein